MKPFTAPFFASALCIALVAPSRGATGDVVLQKAPPLTIRQADGSVHPEYAMVKLSFGFPPGGETPPGQPPGTPERPATSPELK